VCERQWWRDPSGLIVGVTYVNCNRVVEKSVFLVKSFHFYEQSKRLRVLTDSVEVK
jgi:hypothetical protein